MITLTMMLARSHQLILARCTPSRNCGRSSPLGKISLTIDDEDDDLATDTLKGHKSRNDHIQESPNLTGTHSSAEVSAVSKAITKSFLSVDEGCLNSINTSKVQSSALQEEAGILEPVPLLLNCYSSSRLSEAELTSDSCRTFGLKCVTCSQGYAFNSALWQLPGCIGRISWNLCDITRLIKCRSKSQMPAK